MRHKHHHKATQLNTLSSRSFSHSVSFGHCRLVTLHRAHTCPVKHTNMWSHTQTHIPALSHTTSQGCKSGYKSPFYCLVVISSDAIRIHMNAEIIHPPHTQLIVLFPIWGPAPSVTLPLFLCGVCMITLIWSRLSISSRYLLKWKGKQVFPQ